MAEATTNGDGVIVKDITDQTVAGRATGKKDARQPSGRQQYPIAKAERTKNREQKEADKLIARIALASDPKLLCKARMAGYAARLDERPEH